MSASHLPPELLLQVFTAGLGSHDLARVCCSCRHFRDLAEPILYVTVSLGSTDQMRSFILALLASPSRGQVVRSLELDWFKDVVEEDEPSGYFWQFHTACAFLDSTSKSRSIEIGPTPIDREADARGLSDGICNGIQELVPSAHVVLLLDMLPRLHRLRVVPSSVEFWFWAAFPNPCDLDTPKRLPQGLLSLESLDVHYRLNFDPADVSVLNEGRGFAHIKLIAALLLPNLLRLSFGGEDGEEDEWQLHYCGHGANSSLVDLDRLRNRSGVTHLKLRGTLLSDAFHPRILDMLAAPESMHMELEEGFDFATYERFIARPTLRNFALVEYPGDYSVRDPEWQPLMALRKCDHLTHIMLPVYALAPFEDDDLASAVPRGVEHVDLMYPTNALLIRDIDRLVKLVHRLAERGSRVRRLTIRPALDDSRPGRLRTACAASGIAFAEEPCIEAIHDPAYRSDLAYEDISPDQTSGSDTYEYWDDIASEDDG